MLVVKATREALSLGVTEEIASMDPDQQFKLICGEISKPRKAETVRRKLLQYWWLIEAWADNRPDLFDAALALTVDELEQRHAAAPDGIRHLREIAKR